MRFGAFSKFWLITFTHWEKIFIKDGKSKITSGMKLSSARVCVCVWSRFVCVFLLCSRRCSRWRRSVGVKRERHLHAAQLLPIGAQHGLHAIVPVGHPGGQFHVGHVKVRLGQRIRTLRRSEVRGQLIGFLITAETKDTLSWLVSSLMCWSGYWCS